MKIAVITMTRDRLEYTKHCFASLEENAGCDFDWYIWDNASIDGTREWLSTWGWFGNEYKPLGRWGHKRVQASDPRGRNIGICKAANNLLRYIEDEPYDVIVRFDNDCEVIQPNTLKVTAELAATYGAIVSPRVSGLLNPPATLRTVSLGGHLLDETPILGGIFMAIPALLFTDHGFRWNENNPLGTGDEAIVPWWRAHGGVCGYLQGWTVNHYETTTGQRERYPEYFARKDSEFAAC